ncbi:hypothetical protein ACFPJ1_33180 [Kribbella qitaiheensis]|uniref:hypothetical protein n=1 Tax=Kribbella qitaiheensis TaxID=1544730 RepID=UPI00360A1777
MLRQYVPEGTTTPLPEPVPLHHGGTDALPAGHTFATDAAAGLEGTLLHVDTNNPTPALDLYESVGMHTVQIADQRERKVPSL